MRNHYFFHRLRILLLASSLAWALIPPPKAPAQETNATLVGLGNGDIFYSRYYRGLGFAGIIKMAVGNEIVDAFCIDYYLPIGPGDTLQIGGPLTDLDNGVDWCSVNFIINNFDPATNLEAAAMQCAIWYFASAPLGPYNGSGSMYQFMSDPLAFFPYDAFSINYASRLRERAVEMIASVPIDFSGDCAARFPQVIDLSPDVADISNCDKQSVLLKATVYDQYGDPMPDVVLQIATEDGQVSPAPSTDRGRTRLKDPCSSWVPGSAEVSGTTDQAGEIHFAFSACGTADQPLITAWAEGKYGTLFFDSNNQLQTLSTLSLVSYSISDASRLLCRDRMVPENAVGCGHGFWKTHPGAWRVYLPEDRVTDVFGLPPGPERPEGDTLMDALNYLGGNSPGGEERILLRQAAAAVLNAVHPDVGYTFTEYEIYEAVADAVYSGSRSEMIDLAEILDQANHLGCGQ